MSGKYIAVDGPIGVGKSGLVAALQKRIGAKTVLDAPNPFLESFYQDMDKFAFQVQLFFLLSRFQQQSELAQRELFSSTTICDYLFQKDRLFASLTLNTSEYALYEKVYSLLQGTIATPDVVIYMQADADTLFDRISEKDERLSLLLPDDYLKEIVTAYQTFFFHYNQSPILVLNTVEHDFINDPKNLDLVIEHMRSIKTGIHYVTP